MVKSKPHIRRFVPSEVWRSVGVPYPTLWGVFLRRTSKKPVAASNILLNLWQAKVFRIKPKEKGKKRG